MDVSSLLQPILGILETGGPVVMLIGGLSVIALALVLVKFLQFSREGVGRAGRARSAVALWRSGQQREALERLSSSRSATSEAVFTAMQLTVQGHDRGEIEQEITRKAMARLHQQQWGLKALDAIAQIAPLLGLFGTVLGMIEAFQALQAAGNSVDPSMLAGGIWVALLTTAAGLAVAMPVSLILTFLESRIDHERVAIETLTAGILLAHVSGDRKSSGAGRVAAEAAHASTGPRAVPLNGAAAHAH